MYVRHAYLILLASGIDLLSLEKLYTVIRLNPLIVYLLIGVTIAGGAGYVVGQSPIPQLKTDIASVEVSRNQIQTQLASTETNNELLLTKIQEISANLTILTQSLKDLNNNSQQTLSKYEDLLAKYQSLLSSYYTLLLKNQGIPAPPEAGRVITKVSGIENGGFDGTGEPWVMQGKGGKSPYAALWQYPSFSSYVTQTVQLSSDIDGLVFDVKPEPVGASITLQLRIGETIVFSKEYSGSSTLYTWKQEVIELAPLFTMREQYGFNSTDTYEIRFSVLSGPDNSARVLIDNVNLVKIEYTPP